MPSALEQLCSAKVFTKLNLRSTYNLVHIHSGDEWKTSGHYKYTVMPYGTCWEKSMITYNDDYSPHWKIISCTSNKSSLMCSKISSMSKKKNKIKFHASTIYFLGYIISTEGVTLDPSKVITSCPGPLHKLSRNCNVSWGLPTITNVSYRVSVALLHLWHSSSRNWPGTPRLKQHSEISRVHSYQHPFSSTQTLKNHSR